MIFMLSERVHVCHFQLVINSKLGHISHHVRDTAIYGFQLSTDNNRTISSTVT